MDEPRGSNALAAFMQENMANLEKEMETALKADRKGINKPAELHGSQSARPAFTGWKQVLCR